MKSIGEYDWSFSVTGGTARVNLSGGQDIIHLEELDQKLWTVLSCPVQDLEADPKTLSILDADGDGRIHVKDIVRISRWLKPLIKDPEYLLRGDSYIPLSLFNRDTREGNTIFSSAHLILKLLKLDQEYISIENVEDPTVIYKATRFNGDGVITHLSTDDEALRQTIMDAASTVGTVRDRSGEDGVDSELIEKFYTALRAYSDWMNAGKSDMKVIFPYGRQTGHVYESFMAVKEKLDDWFMRCSLASFDSSSAPALDIAAGRIQAISDRNLAGCMDEIAACPLAKVNPEGILSLDSGINPVWKDALDAFREAVSWKGSTLSHDQWKAISGTFAPFVAWNSAKKGGEVESLGYDRIRTILDENRQNELLQLINQDLGYAAESGNISQVADLLYIYRDFYRLLNNFITFRDFYTRDDAGPAIFQAGKLYIDQRCCHLCIKVQDIGKHSSMADLSNMFLLYCECTSRSTKEKLSIVVAVTDGSVDNLREGKNGIFYDRNGADWDATIVRIIDNPISIRQAFWTPYRRMGRFISESISKFASQKETEVMDRGMTEIGETAGKITSKEKPEQPAQSFDVAKFAGLFAMIGMALGTILGFFLDLFKGFMSLTCLQMLLVFLALILVISGPSMIMAWMKLRKRNITPLLNANGWAINSKLLINVTFGNRLTSLAKSPVAVPMSTVSGKKRVPWYLTAITVLIVILAVAIAVVLFRGQGSGGTEKAPAEPSATEQVAE